MTVVALVLAAGSSRRMGQPKALLPLGDETFLARIVRILRSTRSAFSSVPSSAKVGPLTASSAPADMAL